MNAPESKSVDQAPKREWVTPEHTRVDHQYTEGGMQMSVDEAGHDTLFGGSAMVAPGTIGS